MKNINVRQVAVSNHKKNPINQLPMKIPEDSSARLLNHMEVVHHQVLKVEYLLESIHAVYSNSAHA